MGFWSGFEGLTGHKPGAFKGFSLKDIIDKDLWERKQRTWSGKMLPQGATEAERQRDLRFSRGGEPMMTNWYKGRGAGGVTPVNPASRVPFTRRQGGFTGTRPTREYPIVPSDRIPHDYARTSPARPWANLQPENLLTPSWAGSAASADRDVGMGAGRFLQLGNPRNIRSGPDLPPAVGMLRREPRWIDKTTTVKKSAAVDVPDTTTTVFKEKVQPASIMIMRIPTSELAGGRDEDRMREMFRILQGMRARRGY